MRERSTVVPAAPRADVLSSRYEAAFLVFVGVLAFLGRDNPSLEYPQVLYLFVLLMALNLCAGIALRLWPSHPSVSATFILANCGTITAILAYSGGADSNLWVLYLLPIFTVCLLLGPRETGWITGGVVLLNAVFIITQSEEASAVSAFEILLKSGFFIFTALMTWRLASRDRDTRQRLQSESHRAQELATRLESAAALSNVGLVSAGVGHDLRNTFMVIGGFAEMLLDHDSLPAEDRDVVERMRRLATLGGETAQQLARHGADAKIELKREDMGAIASGVAALLRGAFLEKRADLDCDIDDAPCPVKASRVHLQRVFLNLLLNALSVTPAGGRVVLSVRREGRDAVARIDDQGPGFPADRLKRLAAAYETTRAGSGGTGLGLFLSARIVREHRGKLDAENREEGGARLTLRLPAATAER